MKTCISRSLALCVLLISPLYAMNNDNQNSETIENSIIVQNNFTNNSPTPRMTMGDTPSSSKKWIWNSPYQDDDCNFCRTVTTGMSLAVGGGCTLIKGIDALCTSCSANNTCDDVCGQIWFPTGYDNCHYAGDICCSIVRWAVTLSMITAPIVSGCSYFPGCTEKGLHCCCQKAAVENGNPLTTQSIDVNEQK